MDTKLAKNKFNRSTITTRDMAQTGLLTALVFIATYAIQFKLPILSQGGLVHTGTVALYIAAIVFGPKKAAFAGAVGMGIFDMVSGWFVWAPCTFVVRGIMGYMLGKIAYANGKNGENMVYNLVGLALSGTFMIAGYFIFETFYWGSWQVATGSIPGDLTQLAFTLIGGVPIAIVLKKALKAINYK